MTLREALSFSQAKLLVISDAPALDSERLLLHVLGKSETAWLYAHGEQELTSEQEKEFEKLVAERAIGKPLAYILGEWEFYGRPFFVNKNVLIPRPETEKLVTEALRYIDISIYRGSKQPDSNHPFVIADIGTGSGCIAITLALEIITRYPLLATRYSCIATDISPAAVEVAKRNAGRHSVEHLIDFRLGDMLSPIKGEKIDLIVSNPPYLPAEALAKAGRAIETAGLKFEPRLALDGGPDGLRLVRKFEDVAVPIIYESLGGKIHGRK